MKPIQRWDAYDFEENDKEGEDGGQWVRYEDHVAAVKNLRNLLAELRAHTTAYPSAIEADQGFDCEDWIRRVCAELDGH